MVPNIIIPPLPEDQPLAVLEFASGDGPIALRADAVVIGRHSQDDVRIDDMRVSRHHARLWRAREGGFEIANLTAARPNPNVMSVNGVVCGHATVTDGDEIALGGVRFIFRQRAA